MYFESQGNEGGHSLICVFKRVKNVFRTSGEMIRYVTLFSLYVYDFCSQVSRQMYSMNLHKVMHSTQPSVRVRRATGGDVALLSVLCTWRMSSQQAVLSQGNRFYQWHLKK